MSLKPLDLEIERFDHSRASRYAPTPNDQRSHSPIRTPSHVSSHCFAASRMVVEIHATPLVLPVERVAAQLVVAGEPL